MTNKISAVVASAIAGIVSFTGVASAGADPVTDASSASCSTWFSNKYGNNCDGWQIKIYNGTSKDLIYDEANKESLAREESKIPATTTFSEGKGWPYWTGGPDDVSAIYHVKDVPGTTVRFEVRTKAWSGDTEAWCFVKGNDASRFSCDVWGSKPGMSYLSDVKEMVWFLVSEKTES